MTKESKEKRGKITASISQENWRRYSGRNRTNQYPHGSQVFLTHIRGKNDISEKEINIMRRLRPYYLLKIW